MLNYDKPYFIPTRESTKLQDPIVIKEKCINGSLRRNQFSSIAIADINGIDEVFLAHLLSRYVNEQEILHLPFKTKYNRDYLPNYSSVYR